METGFLIAERGGFDVLALYILYRLLKASVDQDHAAPRPSRPVCRRGWRTGMHRGLAINFWLVRLAIHPEARYEARPDGARA
jgi:hypothetical protein